MSSPKRRGAKKPISDSLVNDQSSSHMKESSEYTINSSTSNHDEDSSHHDGCSNLDRDRGSILLLLFLYVLQGIPLGLAGSVPLLLQSRNISYKEQAVFSFVYWPFSIKLLWAPIVDAVFIGKIGRRKSWLVPSQYLIGLFMIILSRQVSGLLGDTSANSSGPNVPMLTLLFFILNFLAATQDIAVDGWALTMLSPGNVGYASTCNSVGQTAGYFIGNILFMALESADFCNKYLRSEPLPHGIMTLQDFLFFWGIVFFITTTVVAVLKKETNSHQDSDMSVAAAYRQLYRVVQLPVVMSYMGILLTGKIGFAAADSISALKLIEEGVPKERLALLGVPLVPLQIVLPWVISKYTAGSRPLNVNLNAMPFRLLMGLEFAWLVWITPSMKLPDGTFPVYYYGLLIVSYAFHQVALYCMFVSSMAFHARISDPVMGGTYMTLLNTLSNLGGNWPPTVALWLVDNLTWKSCLGGSEEGLDCDVHAEVEACTGAGGKCITDVDGYYIESAICVVIGFVWYWMYRRRILRLQDLPLSLWKLKGLQQSRD
ncbi:acetyl-coenzyme A transporter 1-like [Diadema setosum]|uniref:acetyl-coenzyme A transporter 1-like n=1 Tax=Diadema setosum TaxID=31175 RepID=UPI003B3A35B5